MTEAQQTRLLAAVLFMTGAAIVLIKTTIYGVPVFGAFDDASLPKVLAPFQGLDAATLETFEIMVTIPVGIMMLVFLRQFIGVSTIGTFMPVLIGVAFRSTGALVGVLLFTIIVALGLLVRLYFERLRLLLVPRLAAILIVVVMVMIALALLLAGQGIQVGASAALFPLVILAMTIERLAVAWEEMEPSEAIKQGLGSLLVALMSYWVMTYQPVEDTMMRFPELLLIFLAATLMMGRYTGLRLSELFRFREVSQ